MTTLAAVPARLWRVVFAAALLAIVVLALWPMAPGNAWFPHADKLQHAAAFVALWALGLRAGCRSTWALALGLLGYGAGIELAQGLTSYRESSLGDVLADAAGVALGRALFGAGAINSPTT